MTRGYGRTAFLLVVVALACMPARGWADELARVTVQLKWNHCFQFAGYYTALEKGFYRDRGLDVRIRVATPDTDVVREVVEGRAEFGVGLSSLILDRAAGRPVVLLANVFQHSALVLVAKAESPTTSVHTLAGKRIMLDPASAELVAYLAHEGLAADEYVTVPHSFRIADLIDGRIDAMGVYVTDDLFRLQESAGEWTILSPRSSGIDFYGDNLFTSDSMLARRPRDVERFVAATMDGWRYAVKHQAEIVDLIASRYASGRSVPQLAFEAARTSDLIMPDVVDVGYINPGRWERIAATYRELGMLPASFSLEGFLFTRASQRLPWWVLPSLGASAICTILGAGIGTYVGRINRRLREAQRREAESHSLARQTLERKLKSSLAASAIAHEISQPLSRILLASNMATARGSSEDSTLRQIAEDADQVVATIDKMSVLLRSVQTDHSSIDLKQIVLSSIHQVAHVQHEHRVEIATRMPDTPCFVQGDAVQLQMMTVNLLRNGIEAMAAASSSVKRIDVVLVSAIDHVQLSVADTGPGWPGGRLDERLLITSKPKGMGIGLHVVATTVENHGGTVSVFNSPSGGACFVVTLPHDHSPGVVASEPA